MNFDIYDILSKIIPGGIIICVLVFCRWLPLPADNTDLFYILLAYFAGYIVDAIAVEIQERFLRKFNEKNVYHKVFNKNKHITEISENYGKENWENDPIAKKYSKMFHATIGTDPRVKSFQNHWVGARNLSIAFIFCMIVLLMEIRENEIEYPRWVGLLIFVSSLQFILLWQAYTRQKFMFNQVLNSYYTLNSKK